MLHAIDMINFGPYGDPCETARIAQAAEQAGWDALFFWDHLAYVWGMDSADPWVLLAVAATATSRIKLGTAVTPLPRRRPQMLAQTLATLDRLDNGRTILGVGIGGVEEEYTRFGEVGDARERAQMLDESLEVLDQLFSGDKVEYSGEHYPVDGVTLSPLPVQRPRIPIWVGGNSRPAMRRAASWDGWMPNSADQDKIVKTPEETAADLEYILQYRTSTAPFDVAFIGYSNPDDRALINEYESAGVTWWLESIHGLRGSFDEMMARIQAGPVRG